MILFQTMISQGGLRHRVPQHIPHVLCWEVPVPKLHLLVKWLLPTCLILISAEGSWETLDLTLVMAGRALQLLKVVVAAAHQTSIAASRGQCLELPLLSVPQSVAAVLILLKCCL